jgi:acetyl coenzyme A synthetase (ADP forming)-like protein
MAAHPPLASLDPIFRPRSVAVVGASRKRDSIGFSILHNLVVAEFNGSIFPVNPSAAAIHSLKAYPSLREIPDPVDLAVIAVPKAAVPGVIDECLGVGVKGLVLITAGFAETGAEGAAIEAAMREKLRAAGVRMIGPNCMGVINTDPDVRLNATFAPVPAKAGSIGFVSQSGALGVAILNVADDMGLGLTQFVSMGNKADVSGNDLLEFWEHDPETEVIAMYLESFGNPRRFTEIAKRVSRKKPILVVKSGRTSEGARAASSHTGAIAGADVTVSAILDQCGVLRADTIEDLFDLAMALDRCPLAPGNRVALVTNAGGPAIMATDAAVNVGLEIAQLSDATRAELASFLPPEASLANPVDMIASATAARYARSVRAVLADPGVDMVLVINVTPLLANPIDVLEAIASEARGSKPVLAVMMATDEFYETIKGRDDLPPVYRFPEPAARVLAQLHRYGQWRESPADARPPEFATDDAAVAALLDPVPPGEYLPIADAFRVLELYGIPTARWRMAANPNEALQATTEVGFPAVVKGIVPKLVHKSDSGAVKLGIANEEDAREAIEEIVGKLTRAGSPPEGFLVQEMAHSGHEVIFGLSTDPRFGPLLMFGLGGRYVEVLRDVRFAVTPLLKSEADEMIRGIRGFKLLEGVRGDRGADLEVLSDVVLRVAQLAQRHPRITELDINPFLAAPDRAQAKAVDVRIRVG